MQNRQALKAPVLRTGCTCLPQASEAAGQVETLWLPAVAVIITQSVLYQPLAIGAEFPGGHMTSGVTWEWP